MGGMGASRFAWAAVFALSVASGGCGGDAPPGGSPTLTVTTTANLTHVAPAASVPVMVHAPDVDLVPPGETPTPEQAADASHLEFHLDDESSPPLLVTADTTVSVPIPADTPAGLHEIICRVHRHDGAPTDLMAELPLVVDRSAAVNPSAPEPSTAVF
jgi:hypothetical protein